VGVLVPVVKLLHPVPERSKHVSRGHGKQLEGINYDLQQVCRSSCGISLKIGMVVFGTMNI
jgi:hypothetical protein